MHSNCNNQGSSGNHGSSGGGGPSSGGGVFNSSTCSSLISKFSYPVNSPLSLPRECLQFDNIQAVVNTRRQHRQRSDSMLSSTSSASDFFYDGNNNGSSSALSFDNGEPSSTSSLKRIVKIPTSGTPPLTPKLNDKSTTNPGGFAGRPAVIQRRIGLRRELSG